MADVHAVMMAQMVSGAGFIAALDQSGGSTPGALKAYGVPAGAWSSDDGMFALVHQMRVRIITAPSFTGEKVLAAVQEWIARLDPKDPRYEHHMMEALWVQQWHNRVDQALFARMLRSADPWACRSAATAARNSSPTCRARR